MCLPVTLKGSEETALGEQPTWVHRRLADAAQIIRSEHHDARIGPACRYCPFRTSVQHSRRSNGGAVTVYTLRRRPADSPWQPGRTHGCVGHHLLHRAMDAITAPLEPGVIIAGAGSGKTTVMAARVVGWLAPVRCDLKRYSA